MKEHYNMSKRILIMGLPGAGKTTLADKLRTYLETAGIIVDWFNADEIRKQFNDWDFSHAGRIRQSLRMFDLSKTSDADFVICDFVAPLVEMRNNYKADWTIWVDSIKKGRPTFDWKKPTVQMLGRWQPWHDGHRALFERLLSKTGQVVIQIRDVQGWEGSNPFEIALVSRFIKADLDPLYQGQYEIQVVPNVVHIGWGRGVGYTSGEEVFDDDITSISATKVRAELGL